MGIFEWQLGVALIIGGGGSLLGLGTDIGGSVRIPAHVSGICSLKPTTNGRLYMSGMRTSVGIGNASVINGIYSVNGFLASSVDGLEVAMRALLNDAHPAFPPEYGNWLTGSALSGTSYTAVYNLVGCPVGALPITRQTKEDGG